MYLPKVVVPFTNLHPVTKDVLESYDLDVRYVPLAGDADAYRLLLQRLWYEDQTVVIVEQDVVPWPGAIEELYRCSGMWCSCSYLYCGGYSLYHMLGCAKLSARLMRLLPDLWDEPTPWHKLDAKLRYAAEVKGETPHPHRPPVIHLNPRELARVD